MNKLKLCIILGTRPEAIKLAPLVFAARRLPEVEVIVCNTGQHRDMTAQVLALFGIEPRINLDIMRPRQTLTGVTVEILSRLESAFADERPAWVVVQGDTTTTFAGALAAFYQRIPVAHVEAGLRTGDIYSPWPEEMNRRMVSEIATLHFPPTEAAAENLYREGCDPARIEVTGNTGIDALMWLVARLESDSSLRQVAESGLQCAGLASFVRPFVLITGHRRESFGPGFDRICAAIARLAQRFPDHDFIYPVHPNPAVQDVVRRKLGDGSLANVLLVPPLEYLPFVYLMKRASLVLTDSGGVQEEAPSLGKRVIVLRDVTERNEAVGTGLVRLAGTDPDRIFADAVDALSGAWNSDGVRRDIYGDGRAAERVLERIATFARG